MTPDVLSLVAELHAAGVALRADGDRLLYRPRHKVTSAQRARLAAHKLDLISHLRTPADLTKTPAGAVENRGFGDGAPEIAADLADPHPPCTPPSPEAVALATVPAGWTGPGWCSWLRHLANACEVQHPDRAAELRAAADVISGGAR